MNEEQAISFIAKTANYIIDVCQEIEQDGIPPEILLTCLIQATHFYQAKCSIPLDRVVKALKTAEEGDSNTCTT